MKILLVNTSERTGGAAIAANRLREALIREGLDVKMLVRDKMSDEESIVPLERSWKLYFYFIWERFVIWVANRFHRHRLFEVDIANVGTDITTYPEFKQADVIHLHWINQGFLSLKNLDKILHSGKSVVWTMHDMWPFTGICHYSGNCENFREECRGCHILYSDSHKKDLSTRVFLRKKEMLEKSSITFVACSKWLGALARNSKLLENQRVVSIPNAINTKLYHPTNKAEARRACHLPEDKLLLLFTAYKTTSTIKGVYYLEDACRILAKKHPELRERLGIIAVGKDSEQLKDRFPFDVFAMNYVTDERTMVRLYNSADVFVIPSIQDNLPNTVVEAMACGVPCVGFQIGGIPQMIDHLHNGYVAEYKNAKDLANGILWVLTEGQYDELCEVAYRKAVETYSEHIVARQYINLYNKITNSTNG